MSLKEAIENEIARGPEMSMIALIDRIIEYAQELRASDIHIDPTDKGLSIRFRVDGVLQQQFLFPAQIQPEVVSRIKVLAGLRTDEHQAAQDGRFRISLESTGPIDVRVSIAPTYYGENVVLRLLADTTEEFALASLGLSDEDRKRIEAAVKKPTGMILATGPTGSGKTTTLYTLIKMINKEEISIVTIEDPIEYAISGIEQIQVNAGAGLTFANGLRSILRQDPNVIMVGEIRDVETAAIAVNAALTGHLLLSTLHTNDASTTLPRLLDMKIEPYLVASTVSIAVGQRLMRRICPECKREKKLTDSERQRVLEILPQLIVDPSMAFYEGAGCPACNNRGYKGRICVNEVLVVDNDVREAILQKASAADIRKIAIRNGMTTMLEDALYKARDGHTTIEEALRVVNE